MASPARFSSGRRRSLVTLSCLLCAAAGTLQAAPASIYDLGLSFVDDGGATRALSQWRSRPVVIAMAYGACRSICSGTLRTLEDIQAAADAKGVPLDIVVVGLAPAEDTPKDWADYRRSRHLVRSNWTFLCGSAADTRAVARFLGIRFWSYGEHLMHDFKVVRLDGNGAIAGTIDWDHRELSRVL